MTSLYDALSTCATRCYLRHVTVEMSHLRQVKIAASNDGEDWLTVDDTVENCPLLPGDRSVLDLTFKTTHCKSIHNYYKNTSLTQAWHRQAWPGCMTVSFAARQNRADVGRQQVFCTNKCMEF